ncbi:MAG: gamma-glutamylaminecyclotransferase [Bradymonadia bacterium]|jgi:gamma-glutamylaminecyclotransferase
MIHLIFVYGTLMRGLRNHHLLAHARFVRDDKTAELFTLLDFGRYPAVVPSKRDPISGELYEVDDDTLATLDALERYPQWYDRIQVPLSGGGRAWLYVFTHSPDAEGVAYSVVPGGAWMPALVAQGRLDDQRPGGLWSR